MEKRTATITDAARALGVSATTVHKAIYHKKGVSEATRQKILEYLRDQDFQLNRAASALKRRQLRLAYAGVAPAAEADRFYYSALRGGVMDAYAAYRGYNVVLEEYCSDDSVDAQAAVLKQILAKRGADLDGLILNCVHETLLSPILDEFIRAGIRVVTLNSDASGCARSAYICADNDMAGRVAGELLLSYGIPQGGQVLLIGGYRDYSNHRRTFSSFVDWLARERPDVDVIDLYQTPDSAATEEKIQKYLRAFPEIYGAYCVTARGTLAMCRALEASGMAGRCRAVGTDVYCALRPYFERKTLTASIFQNPRAQGARALRSAYDLVTGEHPVPEYQYETIGIAIRNNMESFLAPEKETAAPSAQPRPD